MDWTAPIDIYCERVGTAFWAEPLNAISNIAFPIGALIAAYVAVQRGRTEPLLWILIVLGGLIGVGSFLFHTFANVWSVWADVIPIWTFVVLAVALSLRAVIGMDRWKVTAISLGLVALFATLLVLSEGSGGGDAADLNAGGDGHGHLHLQEALEVQGGPSLLNGSEQYAPAVIALMVFAWATARRGHAMAPYVLAATLLFALSLSLRTVDLHLCPRVPHGTHYLWHLLNGTMIGVLLVGLARHGSLPNEHLAPLR